MKKFIFALITISSTILYTKANAQWANNGTHIYNTNSGYVGIGMGTTTPTSPLTVFNEIGLFNNGGSASIRGNLTLTTPLTANNFVINAGATGVASPYIAMWVKNTTNPETAGNIDLISAGTDGNGLLIGNYNPTTSSWTHSLVVKKTGQVSIGSDWPDLNYKLSVCGKIRAQELKVETGWCDYVFKKDYKLMPLNQLKTFVNTNYHLPEIPTENEVEKEGVSLGNMQMLQMKKIEELILYILQLNERIQRLEDALKKK